jgi:hypothetical protein
MLFLQRCDCSSLPVLWVIQQTARARGDYESVVKKVFRTHTMKAYGGSGRIASLILNFVTIGWRVDRLKLRSSLSKEGATANHWVEHRVGTRNAPKVLGNKCTGCPKTYVAKFSWLFPTPN